MSGTLFLSDSSYSSEVWGGGAGHLLLGPLCQPPYSSLIATALLKFGWGWSFVIACAIIALIGLILFLSCLAWLLSSSAKRFPREAIFK